MLDLVDVIYTGDDNIIITFPSHLFSDLVTRPPTPDYSAGLFGENLGKLAQVSKLESDWWNKAETKQENLSFFQNPRTDSKTLV